MQSKKGEREKHIFFFILKCSEKRIQDKLQPIQKLPIGFRLKVIKVERETEKDVERMINVILKLFPTKIF